VVGQRPEFYYEDIESGKMATHFGLNGRDCVKDYGELKTQKGSQP
jgi:hypothetical protein